MDHYSPTSLLAYLRCAAQFYFRYIEGLKIPPAGRLVRGRAVHAGVEHNMRQKIASKVDVTLGEISDATASAFDDGAKDGLADDGDEPGKLKDEAIMLARLHRVALAPTIQPAHVEHRMDLKFDNVPYKMIGIADLVQDNGTIRDIKTRSRKESNIPPRDRFQLSAYSLARRQEGAPVPEAAIDSLVMKAHPEADVQTFAPTTEDERLVLSTLAAVNTGVASGTFPPNRDSMLCSRRHCGYFSICEKTHGGRVRD